METLPTRVRYILVPTGVLVCRRLAGAGLRRKLAVVLLLLAALTASPLLAAPEVPAEDESASVSRRLASEGWAILSGDSAFEWFCDRPVQAREKFRRAVELDPGNASAHRGWGRAAEDLARCPLGGGLIWADTAGLTSPPKAAEPPADLPENVVIEAARRFRTAAELAPDDPYAWADWGRSVFNLAALATDPAARLELADLADEKYEWAENLMPDRPELHLAWARGLLAVLAAEDDPETWTILWERTRDRYYRYIDLSPDESPKAGRAATPSKSSKSRRKAPADPPPKPAGVSPKLAAWSVFGREVSQAAHGFWQPDKARLALGAVIESMRLLVVAKPEYDLSLDLNSLSRAYLDLMALTAGDTPWTALLDQAGDLAARMIEVDPENPVVEFVLWNWRRAAEAEPSPARRSALIDKALTAVEALAANPGDGRAARFMMVFAAVMEPGPRRDALLDRAGRAFEEARTQARGEAAAGLYLAQAHELMHLAALSGPDSADALFAQAEELYRLSLQHTERPGLTLMAWAADLPPAIVGVSPDDGASTEAASPDDELVAEAIPADESSTPATVEVSPADGASMEAASPDDEPVAELTLTGGASETASPDYELEIEAIPPAETAADREEILFESAVEKYRLAAALPGGERALERLGGLYFRRALAEADPVRAEELWFKALEAFRRAAEPGDGEPFDGEGSFRLAQVFATLAAQGPAAEAACRRASGRHCLGAALRLHREVFAALPDSVNKSVAAGDAVVRPNLSPAFSPRIDPARLEPPPSAAAPAAAGLTERRSRALTRAAADAFLQIMLAIDSSPPPPTRPTRRAPPEPPKEERRVRLQGPDRALLAAVYRLAAGYRQMDPEYKTIYLRQSEAL